MVVSPSKIRQLSLTLALFGCSLARAQAQQYFVPETSIPSWADAGVRAHTNHLISTLAYPTAGPNGETPASLKAIYNLPATGGSGTIAIVIAYHYAKAVADFNVFSKQFGLPQETGNKAVLELVYATGVAPAANTGWNQEAALDIQWAHAMAPNAKIVLVEAKSASLSDLAVAVKKAETLPNVKQISMSWGTSEYAAQTTYDTNFQKPGITYFAASGDVGGVISYPGSSPFVIACGGTKINRVNGSFSKETGWTKSGGGISVYEPRPSYQSAIAGIVGTKRGVPDISFDADPNSGVAVYTSGAWRVFGGTSLACPALAGIVNTASTARGLFATSSNAELTRIYSNLGNVSSFTDIVGGTAGRFTSVLGWDFVTGVGTPYSLTGL